MPHVSIVIPTYNGKQMLLDCLDSLSTQSFSDFEVVVVDGASDDGSREAVSNRFPEARWIALEKNGGFSVAVNAGIRASRGDYILLLNNDTTVANDFVEKMFKAIASDDLIGSVDAKRLRMENPRLIDCMGLQLNKWGHAFQIGHLEEDRGQWDEPREIFGVSGGAAIYRKELFDDIGLFDESLESYFEDVDIAYRARWAGWKSVNAPDAIVLHKGGGTSGKMPAKRAFLVHRNMIGYRVKNAPAKKLIGYLLNRLLGDLYWFLAFVKNRKWNQLILLVKIRWAVLKLIPAWLSARKEIMGNKRVGADQIIKWFDAPGLPACAYQGLPHIDNSNH